MVPRGDGKADIIQAGSRKQKGGEGLLGVVLVQSLIDEADRKDLISLFLDLGVDLLRKQVSRQL